MNTLHKIWDKVLVGELWPINVNKVFTIQSIRAKERGDAIVYRLSNNKEYETWQIHWLKKYIDCSYIRLTQLQDEIDILERHL
jgi:hypothetical protein